MHSAMCCIRIIQYIVLMCEASKCANSTPERIIMPSLSESYYANVGYSQSKIRKSLTMLIILNKKVKANYYSFII